jgi:hypothetical protein
MTVAGSLLLAITRAMFTAARDWMEWFVEEWFARADGEDALWLWLLKCFW